MQGSALPLPLPELGNVLQTFASAQQQLADLQNRLQQQADESFRKDAALKASQTKLADLQLQYDKEKASGDELRDGISKRYIELRRKESAVQAGQNALQQERAATAETLKKDVSELQRREAAVEHGLKDLSARAKTFENDRSELQRKEAAVESRFKDMRSQEAALNEQAAAFNEQARTLNQRMHDLDARETTMNRQDESLETRAAIIEEAELRLTRRENNVRDWRQKLEAQGTTLQQTAQAQDSLHADLRAMDADLQAREARLEAGNGYFQQHMDEFTNSFEIIVEENKTKAKALQTYAADTMRQKEELQTEYDGLMRVHKTMCQVVEGLRTELASRCAEFEQSEKTLGEVQEKLSTSNNAYLAKRTEVEHLRAQQAAGVGSRDNTAQLNGTIAQLRGEIASERERLEEHVRNLQAELKTSETNRTADQEAAVAKQKQEDEAEYDQLKVEYDLKTKKVRDLKEQLRNAGQAAEDEIARLKVALKGVRLENSELKKKLAQEQSQVKAKAAAVSKAQEATAEQLQRYSTLQSQYNDLQKEHDALQNAPTQSTSTTPRALTIQTLHTKNASFIQKNRHLTEENRSLQNRITALEETQTKFWSTSRQLRASQQELQSETQKHKTQMYECNKENAELRAKIKSHSELFAERDEALHAQRGELRDCNDENYELRAELMLLEEQLQARDTLISRMDRPFGSDHSNYEFPRYARERIDDGPRTQTDESEENEDSDENTSQSGSEQDAESSSEPERLSPTEERALYHKFMKRRLLPKGLPAFDTLQPIQKIGGSPFIVFRHDLPRKRRNLHCPKRSLWCGPAGRHALVFAPTREYSPKSDQWTEHTRMVENCGQTFDFYMNRGPFVYYVGIYRVLDLRDIHPPGAKITSDVSRLAMELAAGVSRHLHKLGEGFPGGVIQTEAFGLQCVGFDAELYDRLRARFTEADSPESTTGSSMSNKRKAAEGDLRGDKRAKAQKL